MNRLYFISVLLVVLGSCHSPKQTIQANTSLFDTKWLLKKIHSDGKEEPVNTKAFIRFDKEKGSAGGNGSCNSYGSSTSINGTEVSFKNIFSTKMFCDEVQKIENQYFNHLQKVNRFEVRERSLSFYHDKKKLLEFIAE